MEDLPLGRTAALVPEFAVKTLPWAVHFDDDDDDDDKKLSCLQDLQLPKISLVDTCLETINSFLKFKI